MRFAAFAFVIFISTAASALELDAPRIPSPATGVTPTETCVLEAKRELTDYFHKEFHAKAFVDMQPILPTERSIMPLRGFYFWVRVSTEDAKQYRAGAVRVMVGADSKCDATGFISKAEILASRAELTKYFPAELIPKILWYAETPQK